MREKRMLQNEWLRGIAIQSGLNVGSEVIIRERSMLKDGSYITRQIRSGLVLKLYPYHFYCKMADGTQESFRYNEFLGNESRLIRLKKEGERKKRVPKEVLLLRDGEISKDLYFARFFAII